MKYSNFLSSFHVFNVEWTENEVVNPFILIIQFISVSWAQLDRWISFYFQHHCDLVTSFFSFQKKPQIRFVSSSFYFKVLMLSWMCPEIQSLVTFSVFVFHFFLRLENVEYDADNDKWSNGVVHFKLYTLLRIISRKLVFISFG